MPTYVYRCRKCKHRFELFHSISDESVKRCPRCKSKAERVPAAGAGILFKGSGFYITDYRSKSYKDRAKQEKSAGTSGSPSGSPSGSTSGSPGGSTSGSTSGDSGASSGKSSGDKGAGKKGSRPRSGGTSSTPSGGD
jgi:putative FmdB family regulatory protein